MPRRLLLLITACALLAACSPTFNWRELRVGSAGLKLMLPCKPDRASRSMVMAGHALDMHMVGCEAGGALFAVSWVDVADAARLAEVQAQWQAAMLAAMQVTPAAAAPQTVAYVLKGANAVPAPVRLSVQGRRPDGSAVQAQALWFARGAQLYHAVVYADRISPDAADPFLAGFELP